MYLNRLMVMLLFCFATLGAQSQDETSGENNSALVSEQAEVSFLVVPMMDKMFLSNMSHEIGKYNGMNFREVRKFFTARIVENALLGGFDNWNMSSSESENDSLTTNINMSLGYDYDLVTVYEHKEETKIKELWESLQSKSEQKVENRGAYLDKGEIKEFYDGKERFMNAKMDSSWVVGTLLKDNPFDYILVINELDINKPRPNETELDQSERTLKLHFTLFDGSGNRIYGNATFGTFDENELDVYEILNNALFSSINRMLAECSNAISLK